MNAEKAKTQIPSYVNSRETETLLIEKEKELMSKLTNQFIVRVPPEVADKLAAETLDLLKREMISHAPLS